jgi:zinc transporter 2
MPEEEIKEEREGEDDSIVDHQRKIYKSAQTTDEEAAPHHHHHHDHDHDDHDDHDHGENLNIKAAVIHIIGDIVQSIGVVIAAGLIYYDPKLWLADPICTFIFTILCFFTTVPILIECIRQLMESTPNGTDIQALKKVLNDIPEVEEIHDLHVWSMSHDKLLGMVHIVATQSPWVAQEKVIKVMRSKFKIMHTTVQVENRNWQVDHAKKLCCDSNLHV